MILDMPTRKPHPIQAVPCSTGFRLTRPGARYAVRVSAVDAAGNRATSETGYLTAVAAGPAVAAGLL